MLKANKFTLFLAWINRDLGQTVLHNFLFDVHALTNVDVDNISVLSRKFKAEFGE